MSGLMKMFGVDKLQKLAGMVKDHGGVRAALYQIYWTDDLKVCHGTLQGSLITQHNLS